MFLYIGLFGEPPDPKLESLGANSFAIEVIIKNSNIFCYCIGKAIKGLESVSNRLKILIWLEILYKFVQNI